MKSYFFLLCLLITISIQAQSEANQSLTNDNSNLPIYDAYPIEGNSTIDRFKMYATENMWNFIKLDTKTGKIWQVQFDVNGSNRFTSDINSLPLIASTEMINGRFELYPTQNIYNFILLDQVDGRTWQVQWAIEYDNRFILSIN